MNVAILGASNKPDRYSYKALQLLVEKRHTPFPVHPLLKEINGIHVYRRLSEIPDEIHTITIYLSPQNQQTVENDILQSKVQRVIFNPGTENPELAQKLQQIGIETVNACTLILLKTGQF